MGQRREVAGAAERAVLGHDRGDPGVEHRRVALRRRRSGRRCGRSPACAGAAASAPGPPRAPPRRPVPAACERTRLRCRRSPVGRRDVPGGERAETGGDPVDAAARRRRARRWSGGRPAISVSASLGEPHARAVPGDGDDVGRLNGSGPIATSAGWRTGDAGPAVSGQDGSVLRGEAVTPQRPHPRRRASHPATPRFVSGIPDDGPAPDTGGEPAPGGGTPVRA